MRAMPLEETTISSCTSLIFVITELLECVLFEWGSMETIDGNSGNNVAFTHMCMLTRREYWDLQKNSECSVLNLTSISPFKSVPHKAGYQRNSVEEENLTMFV